jgi:hypothetical protein
MGSAEAESGDVGGHEGALRPSFYALRRGGLRDYATLLHAPYTAWHLSYVGIGAALASSFSVQRLVATLVAFFLAVGIAAHAMDELHTRPLGTDISAPMLAAMSGVSMTGAVVIGAWGAVTVSEWLWVFVAVGSFLAAAYSLELFGGWFHSDWWFAVAWAGFPLVTAYFAQAGRVTLVAMLAAGFAIAASLAQRALSTHVRGVRRAARHVAGHVEREDGSRIPITREYLIAADETALRCLVCAIVLLASTLTIARLT